MSKAIVNKILNHCDRDEIVNKLLLDISISDIHEWLVAKYSSVSEKKLILTEKNLKVFKDNYLDIYHTIQEDMHKTKLSVINDEEQLDLAVKNNPTYKSKIMQAVGKEIDVRQMIAHLCAAIEIRVGQVFDQIQADPANINTKIDRLLIDYAEVLGTVLEKYYKFTENPADQVIQHNVTLQVVDQHVLLVQECIRETLQSLDLEASMLFMDLFAEKMTKLKLPSLDAAMNSDTKLAEAKVLSETINKKLNT